VAGDLIMAEKVGVFGGSFDPIHFGHLNLAIQVFEKKLVDKIIFIPASCSPFKADKPPKANKEHRINMLKLAIEGLGFVSIDDIELQKEGVSYTIDTLRSLKEKFTNLRLIVAIDTAMEMDKWKNYQEVVKIAPLIVGRRENPVHFPSNMDTSLKEMINKNLTAIKYLDISSTDIRERLNKSLYCSHLVPAKVLDYIYQHKLYCLSDSK